MATQRDFKLNADGDWDLTGGQINLVSDGDAIKQSLQTRLTFFLGEWFLDQEAGVPYFQSVLVKNPDPNLVTSIFREAILETPGVAELISLDLTFDRAARRLSVSYRASTDLGELIADTVEAG